MECQERIGISMDQMEAGWIVWLNQWAGEGWQEWTYSVLLPWQNQIQVGTSNSYLGCCSLNGAAHRGLQRSLGKWGGSSEAYEKPSLEGVCVCVFFPATGWANSLPTPWGCAIAKVRRNGRCDLLSSCSVCHTSVKRWVWDPRAHAKCWV